MLSQLVKNDSDMEVITTINYQKQPELVVITTKWEGYDGSLIGHGATRRLVIGAARRHYAVALEDGFIEQGESL